MKPENIIIFTASTKTNNEINQMANEGAKYILRKPFSLNELKLWKNLEMKISKNF